MVDAGLGVCSDEQVIWKKVLTKAIGADKKWAGFLLISLYIK